MTGPNTALTAEDHVIIGNGIKGAQEQILEITRHAPLGSDIQREAVTAMVSLERLRTTLDNLLFQLVPNHQDPRLIRHMVYCTEVRLQKRLNAAGNSGQDAFADWEMEG